MAHTKLGHQLSGNYDLVLTYIPVMKKRPVDAILLQTVLVSPLA